MTKRLLFTVCLVFVMSASAQNPGPTSRDQALQVARALETSELDLFLTKGSAYAPLEEAAQNAERKNPKTVHITLVDSISGTSGDYIISIVVSSDAKHFRLSLTPKTSDCSWSLFSDERGVIYFGKPIDCTDKSSR